MDEYDPDRVVAMGWGRMEVEVTHFGAERKRSLENY
jgi:hypothetical protein